MRNSAGKRLAALGLAVILPFLCAATWGTAPLDSLDLSDRTDYKLPVDLSVIESRANEKAFTDTSYEDSTISVKITSGRVEDKCDYWVADVIISDPSQMRTASASGNFLRSAEMDGVTLCTLLNAVVGLNGDFTFGTEKKGFGYYMRQGTLYKDQLDTPGHWLCMIMDILLVDEDGDFHIVHNAEKGSITGMQYKGKRILNSFCFGPALVVDGKAVEDFEGADAWLNMASTRERSRIAFCQVDRLHYRIIKSSGNYNSADMVTTNTGLTLAEFAALCERERVQTAYNLDGGDSALLYFHNDRVYDNKPNTSLRRLQDVIYFVSSEGL